MKSVIQKCPITVAGLILAFFSLGNLWKALISKLFNLSWLAMGGHYLFAAAGLIFTAILLAKFILEPGQCFSMLKKPGMLASFTTVPMAMTIFAGYLGDTTPAGWILWLSGLIIHFGIMLWFTWKFVLHNFSLKELSPSWYIVYVGLAICGFSSVNLATGFLGESTCIFSMICFALIFIGIILRYRKYGIDEMQEPLLCINSAIGIVLISYLRDFDHPSMIIMWIGFIFSVLIWVWLMFHLYGWLKDPFFPSDAAFSFPFVVSAIASMETMKQLMNSGFHNVIMILVILQALIALIMALITAYRFVKRMA